MTGDEGTPIGELLNILRRRVRIILAAVVLLTGLATLYGLQIEPEYTATASVMIEPRKSRVVAVEEVLPGLAASDATAVESQINVIRSRDMIVRTMEALDLFNDPEFGAAVPEEEASSGTAAPKGFVRNAIDWSGAQLRAAKRLVLSWPRELWRAAMDPGREAVSVEPISPEEQARETAITSFVSKLSVGRSGSSALRISFTSPDPAKAAGIANNLANDYISSQLQGRLEATDRANLWLGGRLQTLQDELLDAERAIARFRVENQLMPARGTVLSEAQLADLNRVLIETRARKVETEAKLRLIRELRGSGEGLDSIAEVVASSLVAALRQQEAQLIRREAELRTTYGERHPQMQTLREERADIAAQIRDEINRVARSLENELTVLETREQNLEQELDAVKQESAVEGQAEVRLRELEREAAARRALYETFLTRYQETRAQEDLLQPDARIIFPAQIPGRASTPSPKIFAAVGLTASLAFGCMLALLLEQLDRSLRSARQVERILQAPCLGLVPKVKERRRQQALHGYLRDKPRSAYTVAMRALYTATLLSEADAAPRVILVTSALPGEGKTSLASSLAVLAGSLGKRTLLIDLDLWHPSVAREFGFRPDSGIEDVIIGEQDVERTLVFDEATGIDVLPVKSGVGDTMALLTSQRLAALLADLRASYDCIVIDSPPLLGPSDAPVLSFHADATIFVVRWERTKREAAAAGLKVLRDMSAHVIGVVLAQVDLKRQARYRYGDATQYYSKYRKYYMD